MQWEYKIPGNQMIGLGQAGHNYTADLVEHLNELGKEGWEAIGFDTVKDNPGSSPRLTYVLLKRPVKK